MRKQNRLCGLYERRVRRSLWRRSKAMSLLPMCFKPTLEGKHDSFFSSLSPLGQALESCNYA